MAYKQELTEYLNRIIAEGKQAMAKDKDTKPAVVTQLDTTKLSIFKMDPAALYIIGVDGGDENTEGYDPRVKLPTDPLLIESILTDGVVRPILAYTDGERTVVADGKRRTLHARAANLLLQSRNPGISADNLIKVPVMMFRGDATQRLAIRNIANSYAVKDDPIDEARAMQKMLDKGASLHRIMTAFGLPKVQVEDRLRLLNLDDKVMKAVSAQEVTLNAALEMVKVPMAEQVRILQKARDAAVAQGKTDGKLSTRVIANEVAATRATGNTTVPQRKTPKDKVNESMAILDMLAHDYAKYLMKDGDGKKPDLAKTPPNPDAVYAALRKLYMVLGDGTQFSTKVRNTIKELQASAGTEDAA